MIPIGLPNERWTLEAKLAHLYGQRGDLKKARQARATALEVVNALSQTVLDTPSRTVFLQFAHDQIGVAGQKPA